MFQILNTINTTDYERVQSLKLANSENVEVLHISLEKEAILKKHTSPKDALLIVLEGQIAFHINNNSHILKKHQLFNFAKNDEHWVEAKEHSNFIIIR